MQDEHIFAITKKQIEVVVETLVKLPYVDVASIIDGLKRLPQIKIQESENDRPEDN
jgi:hypothetical protein